MKAFMGIDPGKSGAAVVLTDDGEILFHDFSDIRSEFVFANSMRDKYHLKAILEVQENSIPSSGRISVFSMGRIVGIWQTILTTLNIDFLMINPRGWQSRILFKKNRSMVSTKDRSIATAHAVFPESKKFIYLKKHHNRADALLLALFLKHRLKCENGGCRK